MMLPTAAAVTTRRRSFARRVGLVAVIVGHNHRLALAIAAIPAMLFAPSAFGADDAAAHRCWRPPGHSDSPPLPRQLPLPVALPSDRRARHSPRRPVHRRDGRYAEGAVGHASHGGR